MVNTLRRVKERVRENSECSSSRDEVQKASPNSSAHSKPRVSSTSETLRHFVIKNALLRLNKQEGLYKHAALVNIPEY